MAAAKKTGKNVNTNDDSNSATVSVDSTTAKTLLVAQPVGDLPWSRVIITNDGNKNLRIRLRSAVSDNLKDGEIISPGESKEVIKISECYTGEISGIFESGGSRDVQVVNC